MESTFDLSTASSSPDFFRLIFSTTETSNSSSYHTTLLFISERERREYLRRLQEQTTLAMLPAILFILLMALVGLIGNSLVLYVYSRKFRPNATRIFICVIAVFDLVSNVLLIPGEVYDMLNFWDFDQPMFCRARLWLNAVVTIMSASTLNALAVLRYRKICVPFGWQITFRRAKILSFILLMISLVFAAPYGIINGRQRKPTPHPGIYGSECTTDDAFIDTIWPFLNSCFFIFLFFSCSTAMVVSYSCICIKTWQHSRSFSRVTSAGVGSSSSNGGGVTHSFSGATETASKNSQEESDNKDPTKDTSKSHQDSSSDEEPSCSVKISTSSEIAVFSKRHLPGIICESGNEARSQRSESKRNISTSKSIETKASIRPKRSLNRTTVMLIIISAVYIIGFLPLLALITWASANTEELMALHGPRLALFHVFIRSYFLNCAANPVIYGICDLTFRKECRKILCCSRV